MRKWLGFFTLAANAGFTLAVYDQLPVRIASHWGLNGPNGWSSRELGAWILPAVALLVWLLLRAIPAIDPRRANYAKFQDAYDTLVLGVMLFFLAIQVAMLGYALGWPVRVESVVPVAIGFLFILTGYILPRTRSTWFIGIRTPWTLSSDVVWDRTHRLGGYTMAAAGVLFMTLALTRSLAVLIAVICGVAALTLYPVVYSYFAWRGLGSPSPEPHRAASHGGAAIVATRRGNRNTALDGKEMTTTSSSAAAWEARCADSRLARSARSSSHSGRSRCTPKARSMATDVAASTRAPASARAG